MLTFVAKICSFTEDQDSNALILALGDDPIAPTRVLMLQKSIELDEQDIELGMDTYCIMLNHGPTFYGGIEKYFLNRTKLELVLSHDCQDELGISGVLIGLSLSDSEFWQLSNGLTQIFEDAREKPEFLD